MQALARSSGRLHETSGRARTAAAYMLARSAVAGVGAVSLLLTGVGAAAGPASGPVAAHTVLALLALAVAPLVLRADDRDCGRWMAAAVVVDLGFYAGYSAAFADRPGAGSLYGVLALLMGPLLWGWRGLPLTAVPVGLAASFWPQRDALGVELGVWQTWMLVLLFALPTAGLTSLVRRGGARIARAEGQFQAAFDHASSGMALLDADHRVLRANHALLALVGLDDLAGSRLQERAVDAVPLEQALLGLSVEQPVARFELELGHADGHTRWASVVVSAICSAGQLCQVVVQAEDVTDRRSLQEQLSYQATHDLLTGLPNQRVMHERIGDALRRRVPATVLFLDLDRFKLVNDSLGHAAGDRLLIQAAERLRSCLRPADLVARLGGDEFVVLCEPGTGVAPRQLAERIVEALRPAFELAPEGSLTATGSVGVAVAGPGATVETMLRDADTAMYAAKRAGGNRVVVFTEHLRADVVHRQELESGLRQALARDELSLHYQPIVDGHDDVVAVEALLRWSRDGRPMDPGALIAVAEQSDLIVELGLWVLRRALQDCASWPADVRLHVNVSPRQLDEDFPARLRALLVEFGPPPGRLCLEVTETALSADLDGLVNRLADLRRLGVRLAIDDFGTGHASLTYLARLPVQEIKVDRSFVSGLPADGGSAAILAGVLAMAHAHGMEVVAEGVETPAQDHAVRRLGCTVRQGYLHHRPMPAHDVDVVLRVAAPVRAVCAARPAVPAAGAALHGADWASTG